MNYQRVLLKLGEGSLARGLKHIIAQVFGHDRCFLGEKQGALPPAQELLNLCQQWRQLYGGLCQYSSTRVLEKDPEVITNVSWEEFKKLSESLVDDFKRWLASESFAPIFEDLLSSFTRQDELQILITTDDRWIRSLPWHTWKLFSHFPQSDFAFTLPESQRIETQRHPCPIRILAILGVNEQCVQEGNNQELSVGQDLQLLNDLPGVQSLKKLPLPDRATVLDSLWEETIDILFFAGHSTSDKNHEFGSFQINERESIEINEIEKSIRQSLTKGLKLAIFNSCNGLGLAHQLSQLDVPYLIVMRELIPDPIAIDFLKYFLKAFAGSDHQRSTKSLHLAMREARTRLGQTWDKRFPCASWLPVLFQNPTEEYLTWESLQGYGPEQTNRNDVSIVAQHTTTVGIPGGTPEVVTSEVIIPEPLPIFDFYKFKRKLKKAGLVSTIAAIAVIGLRLTTILEPMELHVYDRMMRQLPDLGPDPRLVLVEITEEDIREFDKPMSDETLTRLFKTLKKYQPMLIGFDIMRDRLQPPTPPELVELWQDARIIPVCYTGNDGDVEKSSSGLPPGMSMEVASDRVGFNDLAEDYGDHTIRRQLISRRPRPKSRCLMETSFSARLASEYLKQKKLAEPPLPYLGIWAGGYQWLDRAYSEQILIRYRGRSPIAKTLSMTELFEQADAGKIENWENKIVLIGTTAPSAQDISPTPYGIRMEGVVIHAHMLSQLLSAAEEGERLLGVWPIWQDWLWIWGWILLGSLFVVSLRHNLLILMSDGIVIVILYISALALFQYGFWVPFVPVVLGLVTSSLIIVSLPPKQDV